MTCFVVFKYDVVAEMLALVWMSLLNKVDKKLLYENWIIIDRHLIFPKMYKNELVVVVGLHDSVVI